MPERRRFEQELSSLRVREHENGPTLQEVSVGEPITVDVKDIPSVSDVVKVFWTIPGRVVKDYVETRKKATLTESISSSAGSRSSGSMPTRVGRSERGSPVRAVAPRSHRRS